MTTTQSTFVAIEEVADFLASGPSAEELLQFRPTSDTQARVEELLQKLKNDHLTAEEREELERFEQAEQFMRLVKSRIRAKQARGP